MKRIQGIAFAVLVIVILASTLGVAVFITRRDSPQQAIREYLDALQHGDAQRALSRVADAPAASPLLSDATLRSLNKSGRGVGAVSDVHPDGATVEIAHERVRLALRPVRGESRWLVHGLVKVMPGVTPGVGAKVENAAAPAGEWYLFPGVYEVAAAHPAVRLSQSRLAATQLADTAFVATASLADDGQQSLRSQVSDALKTCAGRKELAPAGCPWAFEQPRNADVKVETLALTVPLEPVAGATFTLADDGTARANLDLAVTVKATAALKSHAGEAPFEQRHPLGTTAVVDLTGATPAVTWTPR